MSYSQYVPKHERPVISMLIKLCLENGNTISVHDSEEFVVKRSRKINEIRTALGSSGEDQLIVRNSNGERIGWWWLIYNNGSDGDPMIVICDYTANEFCEEIWGKLHDKYNWYEISKK